MWIDSIKYESPRLGSEKIFASEVHLWVAEVRSFLKDKERLNDLLSAEEKGRGDRFHFSKDQDRFVISRGILRVLLSYYDEVPAKDLIISPDALGKPQVMGPSVSIPLSFNLSHAGNLILYGFSKGEKVGVDVEKVKVEVEAEKLSQRYFTKQEFQTIQKADKEERPAIFFKLWTCKEAILKRKGVGLQEDLNRVEVADFDKRGGLFSFEPQPHYLGAVSVEGGDFKLNFFRLDEKWVEKFL
jgi:4'-phosphopantetheinyl transferase